MCTRKHPHGRGEDQWRRTCPPCTAETPPRAWGRPFGVAGLLHVGGNTPTGVGKTVMRPPVLGIIMKHPHGRGEDCLPLSRSCVPTETPPRAWGRRKISETPEQKNGNTPTGVGKTLPPHRRGRRGRKHPHGRGEDCLPLSRSCVPTETPPRAWGRRKISETPEQKNGNTPTGVGKTLPPHRRGRRGRKHPHGRGEDLRGLLFQIPPRETPPRAWGRRLALRAHGGRRGNTPTGVGKTSGKSSAGWAMWKHPHGRGEDPAPTTPGSGASETPPRAWGRRLRDDRRGKDGRNTPTGVGKTLIRIRPMTGPRKHPHGRGEDSA